MDTRLGGAAGPRQPAPPGTGGAGWIPPTMPAPGVPVAPPGQSSPTAPPAYPGAYQGAPPANAAPNPYITAPSAVPPSEYGPIRDIYDPNFSAAYYGGAVNQDVPPQDVPAARLTGLEPRSSRRRRTILSGVATALAVFLVVGLIGFAVWQTQQGDDGREAARNSAGTPPALGVADGEQPPADGGDVAAGAPGETAAPTAEPTAVPAAGQDGDEADTDTDADAASSDESEEPPAADDPDAAEEDEPAEDAAADADAEDEDQDSESATNRGGRSLVNLVPADDEVPDGFIMTDESNLDEEGVAATFGDPDAALAQLGAWGWRGHLQRVFERSPEAPAEAGAMTYLVVSVHRFDTPESTDEALTYFADAVITGQGLEVFDTEQIGDESIVLVGSPDGATLVVMYIRTGPYLIRIGGASPDGDPTEDVIELAEIILVNEPAAA